jgi:hypothetical protein
MIAVIETNNYVITSHAAYWKTKIDVTIVLF